MTQSAPLSLQARCSGDGPTGDAAAFPCASCPLSAAALCRQLMRNRVGPGRVQRQVYARGSHIALPGGGAGLAGILRRGLLRVEHLCRDGRRDVLALYRPGDLVGRWTAQTDPQSAEAATDVEICTYDCRTLSQCLSHDGAARAFVIRDLLTMQQRQQELVWTRGLLDSRQRIAAFLYRALDFMPVQDLPGGGALIRMELPRQDWADLTATTVETICRTLADLSERHVITPLSPQLFAIPSLERFRRHAGIDAASPAQPPAARRRSDR